MTDNVGGSGSDIDCENDHAENNIILSRMWRQRREHKKYLVAHKGKGERKKKQIMKMNQCPVNVKMLMQTTTNSMSLTIPRFYLIPILRRTTWMGKKAYFFIANNGNLVSYASATNCGALGKTGPQHSLSPDSLPISFFVCSSQYIGGPSGQHIQTQWLIWKKMEKQQKVSPTGQTHAKQSWKFGLHLMIWLIFKKNVLWSFFKRKYCYQFGVSVVSLWVAQVVWDEKYFKVSDPLHWWRK